MKLDMLLYVIRGIGLKGIFRTIYNSIQRDFQRNRSTSRAAKEANIYPGELQHVSLLKQGVHIEFEHAGVDLIYLTRNVIQVSWYPGIPPIPYSIENLRVESQSLIVEEKTNNYLLDNGILKTEITKNGAIHFLNKQSTLLLEEESPIRSGQSWLQVAKINSEAHIYGLGERAAPLNLRPGSYLSWNSDKKGSFSAGSDPLYIGTPIYLSLSASGSYMIYFENSYKSHFNIGDNFEARFEGGMLRYYFIFGSLEEIYQGLTTLVGRPALPPKWALGYHQSRWGYRSETDILNLVKGFEDHNIPLSAVHLDIDYMDGFRVFTVSHNRFPDIKRLAHLLDQKGIKIVATLNPAVKINTHFDLYNEGLAGDMYCKLPTSKLVGGISWPGLSVFPDFTNPKVREWWGEKYRILLQAGISGFWHDMNEPSSFTLWGDMTLPNDTLHEMDGQKGSHLEAHNIYGLLMTKSAYDGLRKLAPDKRPWIFSRAGWAGLQKYAWNWTGDIDSTWDALGQTLRTILGLCISGHAFSGADIGGFNGNPEPELYLRWFQMSAFLPLFRTHSIVGSSHREPWIFGEPFTGIIRKYMNLRYQLLPYLYTLAWDTAQSGIPPLRPLFWENPRDPSLWDIDDEFMLGDSILIAPVLLKGSHERMVTLPAGEWYSYWDGLIYEGPAVINVQISFDNIPIFVKSGSILPLDEKNILNLHIFPHQTKSVSAHLYSDSGDGYGAYRLDEFTVLNTPGKVIIDWISRGAFEFPYSKVNIIPHGKQLTQVIVDGRDFPIQDNTVSTTIFENLVLTYS